VSIEALAITAVIVIPMLPPAECSPNSRAHWRKKAAAVKAFREAAGWATREALNRPGSGASWWCGHDYGGVVMDVEIAWSGRRKRLDDDNAWASLKACRDGIADVLFFGEDRFIVQGELRQCRGAGTVTVTLRVQEG
jgi:crossover junction endodeoxyribonuclease RusA